MTSLTKALLIAASTHHYVSDSPFTCHIFSHGLLRSERCHAPEGDGPGGGGDPPAKLSLTQAEIDSMIGKRLAEERKKFDGHDDFKAQAAKAKEYEAELTKLREEKELAGKSAEEKERLIAEKARATMQRTVEEATTKQTVAEKRAEAAEARYRDMVISNGLGSALDSSKVLQTARGQAIRAMLLDSKVELDDDGRIKSIMYGGLEYKTPAEAAAAFLKDNNFYASAGPAGTGTQRPNGGGTSSGRPLHEQSEDELLRAASR